MIALLDWLICWQIWIRSNPNSKIYFLMLVSLSIYVYLLASHDDPELMPDVCIIGGWSNLIECCSWTVYLRFHSVSLSPPRYVAGSSCSCFLNAEQIELDLCIYTSTSRALYSRVLLEKKRFHENFSIIPYPICNTFTYSIKKSWKL